MSNLSSADTERLVRLLGMLGSDFDGERASAALMASRLLKSKGLTWAELLTPAVCYTRQPFPETSPYYSWREEVSACLCREEMLTAWEREFLSSIVNRRSLTSRQQHTLDDVLARVARRSTG